MTTAIYSHDGDYEFERIALWDDGEWQEGGEDIDPEGYYEDVPEEVVRGDFDGPDLIAADPEEVEWTDES